jgi:hypothetical protein
MIIARLALAPCGGVVHLLGHILAQLAQRGIMMGLTMIARHALVLVRMGSQPQDKVALVAAA